MKQNTLKIILFLCLGFFISSCATTQKTLKEKELVTIEDDHLRLSKKGLFLADSVILEFI